MKYAVKTFTDNHLNLKKAKNLITTYTFSLLLVSSLIAGLSLGIRRIGGLQTLELLAYDWMVKLHSHEEIDPRLLIVEITDKDIEKQNKWPITDETIAQLIENLQQYKPKVIGLDLYREIVYPPGNQALKKQLQADNLVVIQFQGYGDNRVLAPKGTSQQQIGFNDLVFDVDDVIRRNLMYVKFGEGEEQELYSFALRLSLKYLEDRNLKFTAKNDSLQIGNAVFADLLADSGGYQMPRSETAGWQVLLNYRAPNIARRVTLTEVLKGKLEPSLVKDKVVIIGTSAPSIKDIFYTPYRGTETLMPGVIIHAQMVSQILGIVLDDAPQFWVWSEWVEDLWICGWSLAGAAIAWRLRHPLAIGAAGVAGIAGLWGICFVSFSLTGWIPFIPAALTFAIAGISVLGYKVLYTLFYDSLTGLPNRSLFAKQLKTLKQRNKSQSKGLIAILCLDLDRFKLINDGLGYETGDLLLIAAAQRLKNQLSPGMILARVGADEFAIALKTTEDTTEAMEIANSLEHELAIPFQLKDQNIFTSASIGLALNRLDEDFQPEELLRASHTAMYKAKASGKNRHEVFATKMHEQALKRLQLEADLHHAIANQEFELYYQPIICLKTGTISGFEALVRWQSPTRGFVSPGAFIPIAEETGLIIPMGQWILETACRQMSDWQQQFAHGSSWLMSVNLSSRQFSQPNLVEQIKHTLEITNLDAKNLKLEITESMVMDDVENTITLLNRLKDLGIKMSMDDFGTGFSSFSYLHRFPMDTLKVDRSFVSNMSQGAKNQEIVSTIVMLAHKLSMDVVAEGIETEPEKEILQGLNCEYGQGYLFAKPLAKQDATKLLADKIIW